MQQNWNVALIPYFSKSLTPSKRYFLTPRIISRLITQPLMKRFKNPLLMVPINLIQINPKFKVLFLIQRLKFIKIQLSTNYCSVKINPTLMLPIFFERLAIYLEFLQNLTPKDPRPPLPAYTLRGFHSESHNIAGLSNICYKK